jgi:hypothetical protein
MTPFIRRLARAIALLSALSGCLSPWRDVTFVENMRVLAIRADPPDLSPGDSSLLEATVVDPTAPTRINTLVWIACDPDPTSPDQSTCADYETLAEFQSGGTLDPTALPAGMHILSLPVGTTEVPVHYDAPADVFAQIPTDDVRRTKGALAIILLLTIAAEPPATIDGYNDLFTKVQNNEIPSLLTIKRLRISENPEKNHNPTLDGVLIGDELWGPGLRPAKVHPGESYTLQGVASADSSETYTELDVDDNPVTKQEPLIISWFATVGGMTNERDLIDATTQSLYIPLAFDAMPADRRAEMWLVLRDSRGGVDVMTRGLFLCDMSIPPPVITAVTPASGPPGTLVQITGTGLEDILDVALGSGWIAAGHWDATAGAFVGSIPSDAAVGVQPLVARGKGCDPDLESSFEVTAP